MSNVELPPLPGEMRYRLFKWAAVEEYARTCVARATAAKDAEIEALRAEVERWKRAAVSNMKAWNREMNRANRLAEAGLRVTTAFRAHGEASIAESVRTRRECEDAMTALDAALHPTAAQEGSHE